MTAQAGMLAAIALIVSCAHAALFAQSGFPEAPKQAVESVRRPELLAGASAGFLFTVSQGDFHSVCDCSYESGTGAGFSAGLGVDYLFEADLSLFGSLSFVRSFSAYEREDLMESYVQNGERVLVSVRRNADVAVHYLDARVMGRWYPSGGALSINAGVVAGLAVSSSLTDTKRLATPGYVFYENGTNEVVTADGSLDDSFGLNSARFALTAGVAYDFLLGGFWFTPEIAYEYPLLEVVSESPAWKLMFLHAAVRVSMSI